MEEILLKVGRDSLKINKKVFILLLATSPVKALAAYKNALISDEIRFSDLKDLAAKADIPYPLFFSTEEIVERQLEDWRKNLFEKLPSKTEMRLVARGGFKLENVALIVKDLGRKQEFLKNRMLPNASENPFIGCIAAKIKKAHSNKELANFIRDYLEIDLSELRAKSKAGVLTYITECAEKKNILVSFSSHNFMPQNIDPLIGMSGICVKDKKFPIIFINTRDGDLKPKILESEGRQIFTLVAMLTCIALNRFVISSKTGVRGELMTKKIFEIAGEILVPKSDLLGVDIKDLDELKLGATIFKVTPSMLLARLRDCGFVDKQLARRLRQQLVDEIASLPPAKKRSPLQVNGYGKYNGNRFSREVITAHDAKKISLEEVKNILFRKGKMNPGLLQEYGQRFK